MQLVNKHCSEELLKYTDCVQANPNGWHNYCEEYKVELASCAQKKQVQFVSSEYQDVTPLNVHVSLSKK